MSIQILFFICLLGVLLNICVTPSLTDVSPIIPFFEYFVFFAISWSIVKKFLKGYSKKVKKHFVSIYLMGFFICLFLLDVCWVPNLPSNSPDWGFDPQRYYSYVQEVLEKGYYDGWVGSGMNGIVYFYALIFKIFGCHPLVPLYMNSILALTSVLMLFKMFEKNVYVKPYCVAFLLLIPEFLYYNIMISKDTLCQYGLIFILYEFYRYYKIRKLKNLFYLIVSFILVIVIRSPYAIAALGAIVLFLLFFSPNFSLVKKIMILIIMLLAILIGLSYVNILSSSDSMTNDWGTRIEDTMTGKMNAMEGGSALAAFLTPNNIVEVIIFGFIRSIAYLSPTGYYRFFDDPSWYTFAGLTTLLTGIITFGMIFIVFQYIIKVYRNRNDKLSLLLLFFLFTLFLTGFSTPNFIHSRYRVTYEILYFMLAILSYVELGKRNFIKQIKILIAFLLVLIPIYIIMKF